MRRLLALPGVLLVVLVLPLLCTMPATAAPNPAAGNKAYANGVAAAKAQRYTTAVTDFAQAIRLGRSGPDTFLQLGLAYLHLKRWDDATWALATAESDDVFAAAHPEILTDLNTAYRAGGSDNGAPPGLRGYTMTPSTPATTTAALASREAAQAASELGSGAYYISPQFSQYATVDATGLLSQAAADLQNNSDTIVKWVFLDALPAPYPSLQSYARSLFTSLQLQKALVVAVTPTGAGTYTDRLDQATADRITAHEVQHTGLAAPLSLAVGIARAVTRQADSNDAAANRTGLFIGIAVVGVMLVLVGLGITLVLRGDSRRVTNTGRVGARSAVRARVR